MSESVNCPRIGGNEVLDACNRCGLGARVATQDEGGAYMHCKHEGLRTSDLVASANAFAKGDVAKSNLMPIAALMTTDVVCVAPDVPSEKLRQLLGKLKISATPVVDREGALVGIVSRTDLLHKDKPHFTVSEIMTRVVHCLPESATVARAAAMMADTGVHRLPVLSFEGEVVGIISSIDILAWLGGESGWREPNAAEVSSSK